MMLLAASGPVAASQQLILADDGRAAGYATLAWPSATGASFRLEQFGGGAWVPVYEGTDRATTLSGLQDGTYRFRLSVDAGAPGPAFDLAIRHHPLDRAFAFFGAGALMLVVLVVLLAKGTHTGDDRGNWT